MSASARMRRMSREEFLGWAQAQDVRYEFDGFEPDVVAVLEVLSPSSARTDRIVKLREYWAVPSIRHYAVLEHASVGLTAFARVGGNDTWTALPRTAGDLLHLPALGIEIPVAEFYESVEFPGESAVASSG